MKKFLLLIIILSITFLFGCTNTSVTEQDFQELKKDFFVEDAFNPNMEIMNDYLNELSLLRKNSSGRISTIIDYEIASAQSFIYLTKAIDESRKLSKPYCNTIEYKNTISLLNLSIIFSQKTETIILLPNEETFLRNEQKQFNNNNQTMAKELLSSIKSVC
jgi:hypothetical protein